MNVADPRDLERQAFSDPQAVAIVGMAGRFPGADTVEAYWRNLRDGVDAISPLDKADLKDSFTPETRGAPGFVAARPILAGVDLFDAAFFGMYPREAALADPQHRVFLECAWEALESAGYDPATYDGSIGIFAGCSLNTYFLHHVCVDRATIEDFTSQFQLGNYPMLLGAGQDFLTTRVAYKLDLRGPAMTLGTACSTSLSAVAQACQTLQAYQADMMLAGGVSISFPQERGYLHQAGGMASADGHCRPFDAQASGTVFGSGSAVVLLKRLSDAVADRDTIHAVIRSAAMNNDGARKVGFTAPSVEGQAEVICAAQQRAGIDARSIGYVECHGTATPLGDPIEFAALDRAFRASTDAQDFCALGSAKANIGHLDAAAGVAGLIKATLAVRDGIIPPLTHFETPNPLLGLEGSPFRLDAAGGAWPEASSPRRAGVSALGVGGTNVHVIIEEPPPLRSRSLAVPPSRPYLLPLSARSAAALDRSAAALATRLEGLGDDALGDVAFTLQQGRRAFPVRRAIVCHTRQDALAQLTGTTPVSRGASRDDPPVVFMCPGQGAQHHGMGRALYDREPVFRAILDEGARFLEPHLGCDLRDVLYGDVTTDPDFGTAIHATRFAQPALFLTAYATARLWMSWGIHPTAMIGHSVGELVCATLSGVFTFEDALAFVAERGRLMQAMPSGGMLAVRLAEADVLAVLPDALSIAAVNGPRSCVVSGPHEAIEDLIEILKSREVAHRPLSTSHAFHSAMMDPVAAALETWLAPKSFGTATIPYVSGLTGEWITDASQCGPDYWARHCRECVQFAGALANLTDGMTPILLEVGPGRTLSSFAAQGVSKDIVTVPSWPQEGGDDSQAAMLKALGQLWSLGCAPDWPAVHGGSHHRVPLPTYPFERQRHWIEPPQTAARDAEPRDQPLPSDPTPIPDAPSMPSSAPHSTEAGLVRPRLLTILEELSGDRPDDGSDEVGFLDLGFDSLFLAQLATQVQASFAVVVTFRQLLDDVSSIAALTAFIAARMPPPAPMASAPVAQPSSPVPASLAPPSIAVPMPGGAPLHALLAQQVSAMQALFAQQLQALGQAPLPVASATPAPTAMPRPAAEPEGSASEAPSRFKIYQAGKAAPSGPITPAQRAYIDTLVAAYTARTPGSQGATQAHRAVLADPRAAAGFRRDWKDMVYPIVCARSKGSKLWDVDGNVYVDLVNGYGQTAFGHAPDFVVEAVAAQLREGFAIGPQSPLAGDVAERFAAITGNDRVTFCNTGSEAVMAAIRLARTVTGRDTVVVFEGAYHGQFDEVLVKPAHRGGVAGAHPAAPGIPAGSAGNMVVLPYGTEESAAWIRSHATTLAAVIAEPVQSRRPEFLPREFLAEVRRVTQDSGTALIFDEVVTGFRVASGGMQAVLGIRADLATYGKVIGGGMPIGILAGQARFMDALDGGFWRFGDASFPEVAPTFFAGTFVRHPLALAAARAVLAHLEREGPALQAGLAEQTATLVGRLNAELARRGLTTRAQTYSSWFMFNPSAEDRLGSLFFAEARLRGVHIQEGFPCFLTTAHSAADFALIHDVFVQSLDALKNAGILVGTPDAAPSLAPVASVLPDAVPWTEPQREIWLTAQLGDEASCGFNESVSLSFAGTIDVGALGAALNDVVARHDALRAVFDPAEETMVVRPALTLALPIVVAETPAAATDLLARYVEIEARLPFDLLQGPLIRAALMALAPDRHVLVLTAHHIICDGWSINVILNELGLCYAARLRGDPAALPAAPSFRHYALASTEPSASRTQAQRFWAEAYRSLPQPLDLPADRARPAHKSFQGATHHDHIPASLVQQVKAAGARLGCTLFATLLGAFQLVVARLGGEDDVVVAIPTSGQSLAGAGGLVGHCVNLLPVRAQLDMTQSLATHLRATRSRVLDAFEHQDITYGTIVRGLKLAHDPSRLPLTQIQFNLEKMTADAAFPGLTMTSAPNPKAFSNFDLFANFIEGPDGLRVDCDYNTDLFDGATVARWMDHLRAVLEAIAADTAAPLAVVPLTSPDEARGLVAEPAAAMDAIDWRPVHDLVAERAASDPGAVAVVWNDVDLTYADLEARANRLARHIVAMGVRPGARIGLAVSRSAGMLVTLLAILKAGCAYVPLDLAQPPARRQAILVDADVALVICDSQDVAVAHPDRAILDIAADRGVIDSRSGTPLPVPVPSVLDDTAYVIFTSGSTGRPKGVSITHRSLTNLLWSMAERPGFTSRDTLLAVTTIGFDIAGAELLLPLITGGRVVIADRDEVTAGFPLVARIDRSDATLVQATPSLWRLLIEAGFRSKPGLTMISGGEPLPRDLAEHLLAGGGALWNAYGPTETTIWSSLDEIRPGPHAITIGRPVFNTDLQVLDPWRQPAPTGVAGDLFIGGIGLARGYFGRDDLTAAAFVEVAHPGGATRRLYRTGDRAKRLPDGSLQLLGRVDAQIKLRGFRIELEEIEAVLRGLPGVGGAAVALHARAEAEPRLVAYVVAGGELPPFDEMARGAAQVLPDYMIPKQWVRLDALPLTPNGKLNRQALPEPDTTAAPPAKAAEPPANPLQERLIAIIGGVMKVPDLGRHDNIFALGADSLDVFRIASRLRKEGMSLDARDLLKHPTVDQLSRIAGVATSEVTRPAVVSLQDFRRSARRPDGVHA